MTSEDFKKIADDFAKMPPDILDKVETVSKEFLKTRKIFCVDDVLVITYLLDDIDKDEAKNYVDYVRTNAGVDFSSNKLVELEIFPSPRGGVKVNYKVEGQPFERIRRITGYLTGDLNSWNDAKQAEERERVKHFA